MDLWAHSTALAEAKGVREVVNFMRQTPSKEIAGALMLGVPASEGSQQKNLAVIESKASFLSFFSDQVDDEDPKPGAEGEGARKREGDSSVSRISRIDAANFMRRVLVKRDHLLENSNGSYTADILVVSHDPCALSPSLSHSHASYEPLHVCRAEHAGTSASQSAAQSPTQHTHGDTHRDEALTINVYALFPGWGAGQNVSVEEFFSHWLVGRFNVPLSSNGAHWIKALVTPLLNMQVGGIAASP